MSAQITVAWGALSSHYTCAAHSKSSSYICGSEDTMWKQRKSDAVTYTKTRQQVQASKQASKVLLVNMPYGGHVEDDEFMCLCVTCPQVVVVMMMKRVVRVLPRATGVQPRQQQQLRMMRTDPTRQQKMKRCVGGGKEGGDGGQPDINMQYRHTLCVDAGKVLRQVCLLVVWAVWVLCGSHVLGRRFV